MADKPTQKPWQTYAARKARGRPRIALSLPIATLKKIDGYAESAGRTRTDVIAMALDLCPEKALLRALERSEDPNG